MRKILFIFGIVVVFIILALFLKDQVLKFVVTFGATEVTGAPVSIDSFSMGIFKSGVHIQGLKIYNPKGFPKGILLNMPTISVNYDLPSLLKGKLHLTQAAIDFKEMRVIKNQDGKLNVDSLKVVQEGQKSKPAGASSQKPAKQMPIQIDLLSLNIGSVVYEDFSKGEKPTLEVFDVNVKNRTYKNITSVQYLMVLVLSEAMKPTAIKGTAVYGAATVLGVAFLPAGVASMFIGKDSTEGSFDKDSDTVYNACVKVMQEMGKITKEDKTAGTIAGKVSGCDISIKIIKKTSNASTVNVAARQYMMPKPNIAGGILYQIEEKLK